MFGNYCLSLKYFVKSNFNFFPIFSSNLKVNWGKKNHIWREILQSSLHILFNFEYFKPLNVNYFKFWINLRKKFIFEENFSDPHSTSSSILSIWNPWMLIILKFYSLFYNYLCLGTPVILPIFKNKFGDSSIMRRR